MTVLNPLNSAVQPLYQGPSEERTSLYLGHLYFFHSNTFLYFLTSELSTTSEASVVFVIDVNILLSLLDVASFEYLL